ncbi:2OG-Fe dioxygenase family protein [Streptomyces sp. NBC_00557]|uniref:2OG-Fe dioxygenase family protein n=1 Tax=Streptomyces sp. NBC_00557 TaxID=2975776 RepID=UPI002E8072A4|nr:2OG-Fe dioxygenase family protein [Streptomyces sp. NBC_00557]WUC40310.1 2OG-Fe dioxygenase family protein [Streptomyces sp. NBC_00557]
MRLALFNTCGKISDDLVLSFNGLAPDEYVKSRIPFRFRAFGTARIEGDEIFWQEDSAFLQSEEVNTYAGGIERRFGPLGKPVREFAEELVRDRGVRKLIGSDDFVIGCHQIRIVAGDGQVGLPAPEGFHRDGFDGVAVTVVAAENVSGGISLVREGDAEGDLLLDRVMAPGETLYLDDRRVVHYVSPITPKFPGAIAHRDVVVVTFDLTRERQQSA